jgi:hypothetical protein
MDECRRAALLQSHPRPASIAQKLSSRIITISLHPGLSPWTSPASYQTAELRKLTSSRTSRHHPTVQAHALPSELYALQVQEDYSLDAPHDIDRRSPRSRL